MDLKGPGYLKTLKGRAQESKAYSKHQLAGLELATLLEDQKHKALYIKLAKTLDVPLLFRTAKEIAERKDVQNKGAYFMWKITEIKKSKKKGTS